MRAVSNHSFTGAGRAACLVECLVPTFQVSNAATISAYPRSCMPSLIAASFLTSSPATCQPLALIAPPTPPLFFAQATDLHTLIGDQVPTPCSYLSPPVLTAHVPMQRGSFTAEAAAGVYLEERQANCRCLVRLLAEEVQQVTAPQDAQRWDSWGLGIKSLGILVRYRGARTGFKAAWGVWWGAWLAREHGPHGACGAHGRRRGSWLLN